MAMAMAMAMVTAMVTGMVTENTIPIKRKRINGSFGVKAIIYLNRENIHMMQLKMKKRALNIVVIEK